MKDIAKMSLAFGSGIVAGKIFGNGAWLLAGACGVLFLMNSPGSQAAISKGYSSAKDYVTKKT